mmetsp:Transcript_58000/g.169565  ORF Transcript_58000/g.169565 Transcript_58000/m.169565 type:complete len:616 (-) Transcript_58000:545-2392(-)
MKEVVIKWRLSDESWKLHGCGNCGGRSIAKSMLQSSLLITTASSCGASSSSSAPSAAPPPAPSGSCSAGRSFWSSGASPPARAASRRGASPSAALARVLASENCGCRASAPGRPAPACFLRSSDLPEPSETCLRRVASFGSLPCEAFRRTRAGFFLPSEGCLQTATSFSTPLGEPFACAGLGFLIPTASSDAARVSEPFVRVGLGFLISLASSCVRVGAAVRSMLMLVRILSMLSWILSMLSWTESVVEFMMRMCSFIGREAAELCGSLLALVPKAYFTPLRPKYVQNSVKEMTPSLLVSISASCRPREAASGFSSSRSGSRSWGRSSPRPNLSNVRNSWRSSSSNFSSREDRQAATNSRYSQELSPLTSSAEAAFLAVDLSMPSCCRADITSPLSKMPLWSLSNFVKMLANLLMHVHPTAIFKHSARCIGLRWRQLSIALHRADTSFSVNRISSHSLNQGCLKLSDAVGLDASLKVSSCLHKFRAFWLHAMSFQSGPLRWSSSHFSSKFRATPETLKGGLLEKSSKVTQPMLQTSLFGPQLPIQTSGAMVVGVPATLLPRMPKMPRQQTSAMPRSQTTMCGRASKMLPSLSSVVRNSRMFWPFRSLCTTLLEWR